MPFVSILLPYYKKESYVFQTIETILKQTFRNFELIIIFDEYFKKHHPIYEKLNNLKKKDKRIKIILNKKNLGVAKSRNRGLLLSKGKYIAFIDSDDLWHKRKLEIQIKFMIKNKLKFCHTNYHVINKFNQRIGIFNAPKNLSYSQLINSCDIGLSTVMIEKSIIDFVKFPLLKTKEDYVVWLSLAKKNIPILSLNKPLTYWRNTPNSLSSSMKQRTLDAFRVYYKYEKLNFIYSLFLVIKLIFKSIIKKLNIYLLK